MIKEILSRYPKIYKNIQFIKRVGLSVIFSNWIFQKIFRLNSEVPFSLNFTSKIIFVKNIDYSADLITLTSFAVSGGCYIQAANGIKLGKNFLFAPGVKLISANHDIKDKSKAVQCNPITIGDNVWLGTNVVILPGVVLGENTVVGAGSVVTKSFSNGNCVLGGIPAKIIKSIDKLN